MRDTAPLAEVGRAKAGAGTHSTCARGRKREEACPFSCKLRPRRDATHSPVITEHHATVAGPIPAGKSAAHPWTTAECTGTMPSRGCGKSFGGGGMSHSAIFKQCDFQTCDFQTGVSRRVIFKTGAISGHIDCQVIASYPMLGRDNFSRYRGVCPTVPMLSRCGAGARIKGSMTDKIRQ